MSEFVKLPETECEFFIIHRQQCELEGPYECSACGGHIMFDSTFLDQVIEEVNCPYCDLRGKVVDKK